MSGAKAEGGSWPALGALTRQSSETHRSSNIVKIVGPGTYLASIDNLDVTWTATLLPDDGCGTLSPPLGSVAGGNGDVSLTITPPGDQKSRMVVVLNATDAKGRRTPPRSVQAIWYW